MFRIYVGEMIFTYYDDIYDFSQETLYSFIKKHNTAYYDWLIENKPTRLIYVREKEYRPYCDQIIFKIYAEYDNEEEAAYHILLWGQNG